MSFHEKSLEHDQINITLNFRHISSELEIMSQSSSWNDRVKDILSVKENDEHRHPVNRINFLQRNDCARSLVFEHEYLHDIDGLRHEACVVGRTSCMHGPCKTKRLFIGLCS